MKSTRLPSPGVLAPGNLIKLAGKFYYSGGINDKTPRQRDHSTNCIRDSQPGQGNLQQGYEAGGRGTGRGHTGERDFTAGLQRDAQGAHRGEIFSRSTGGLTRGTQGRGFLWLNTGGGGEDLQQCV